MKALLVKHFRHPNTCEMQLNLDLVSKLSGGLPSIYWTDV
jgi:hypothetical protein